jgi:uncharacterized protein YprB with RNaseH-like and TPR domain
MTPSRLRERLRDVVGPRAGAAEAHVGAGASRGLAASSDPGALQPLEDTLGGEWRSLDSGRYFLVERRVHADTWHGSLRIGDLAERLTESASDTAVLVDTARPPFLFFDLETTGLNGGAGTYAFLVGFGSFDDDGSFVTRQYVMTRSSDERPMLRAVAERLSASGALVSFNGKSFDAPLLETRFLFHRLPWAAAAIPHVDVLHPARRFWRAEALEPGATTCSLSVLEQHVLGARRQDDVPGPEAPMRYFQFIRSGDARTLSGVLEHNRLDLLSLAGLTGRLLELISVGADGARTSREAFALGGVYERAGWHARAHSAFSRALELASAEEARARRSARATPMAESRLCVQILRALAKCARRAGRHDEAARWWHDVLDRPECRPDVTREAAEALAIHHEHRRRDLESARTYAMHTLKVSPTVRHAALRHRLARLERKLSEKPTLMLGE